MPSEGTRHVRPGPYRPDSQFKLLQRNFAALSEQLILEKKRADDAEQMLIRLATRLRDIHNERIAAVQSAAKANAELSLYKIQLEMAQRDILRAQDTVKIVDDQRCEAERSAANARTSLRRLNDERVIQLAREEGRNLGIVEGFERGRAFDLQQANIESIIASRARRQQRSTNVDDYDDEYESEGVSSSRSASDSHSSLRSVRPPSQPVATALSAPSAPVSSAPMASSPAPVPTPAFPPDHSTATPSLQQRQPVFHAITDIHPTIVSTIAPEFHHPHVDIPSDGFIPPLGADHRVHLPPPHELGFTPQPPPAPSLPPILERKEPEPTPEGVRARQLTSRPPTLSELDLGTPSGTSHRYQIPRDRTSNNTPDISKSPHPPQPPPGHQHYFAPVQDAPSEQPQRPFVPPPSSRSEPNQDFGFRSPTTVPTPSSIHLSTRGSRSSIGITVVSPSESASGSRGVRSPPSQGPAPTSVFMSPSMSYDQHPPIISVLSDNQLPPGFVPMSYEPNPSFSLNDPYSTGYMPSSVPANSIQPVIPDPRLLGHHTDSDDEVHSSSSNNTLTTPPGRNTQTLPVGALGREEVSTFRTFSPENPAPTNGRTSIGTSSTRPETSALRRSTLSSSRVGSPATGPTLMMGGASPQPELSALRASPVAHSEALPRSRSGSIAGPNSTSGIRSSLVMGAGSTSPERRASPTVRHETSRPSSMAGRADPATLPMPLGGTSPWPEPVNLGASPLVIPGTLPMERPVSPAPVPIPASIMAVTVPLPLSRPASMVSPPMRPLSRMGSVTRSPPPEAQEPAVREPTPEPDPGPASKQTKKKKKKR